MDVGEEFSDLFSATSIDRIESSIGGLVEVFPLNFLALFCWCSARVLIET